MNFKDENSNSFNKFVDLQANPKPLVTMNKFFIVLILIILSSTLHAQQVESYADKPDSVKQLYYEYAYNEYGYLNGREYKAYYNPLQSSPIFEEILSLGTIYSNGFEYSGLRLGYDMNRDELITMPDLHISSNLYVQINKATVDSFRIKYQLNSYLFKNLTFKNSELPDGYYEIAYSGKSTLIIKHSTVVLVEEGITKYNHKMSSYLVDNEQIYPIKKKKDLLSHYEERKKEIKRQIRKYPNSYNRFSSNQLSDLIRYIESL